MIEWWWLIPAFFLGSVLGMGMFAIFGANDDDRSSTGEHTHRDG